MSVEPQALERSVLERKERDELAAIAEAMGVKAGPRTSKANLIGQILREAGIETADDKPKRPTKAKAENGASAAPVQQSLPAEESGGDTTSEATAAEETTEQQSQSQAETQDEPQSDARTQEQDDEQDDEQDEQRGQQQDQQQGQERQGGGGRGNQQGVGAVAEPGNRRSRRRRGRDRDR